jgi:DHA1 family bicyclomycin/chloramphenicol resistance-like MFS transporter
VKQVGGLLIIALGGLAALSAIAIDISLPATSLISQSLQVSSNQAQLVIGLYLTGFALGQIPAGISADHFGRRSTIIAGLIGFILAGIMCATADNAAVLLSGRFLQGFCAAVGPVVSRAIVRDIAHGERAAHLISILITIVTIGPLLAPSVGSLILTVSGWRGIFWATVLVGVFVLVSGIVAIRPRPPELRKKDGVTKQFIAGGKRFFTTRGCLFGMTLLALPAGAYMAFITTSPAILSDLYGVKPAAFGPMFSATAVSFLIGVTFSRIYVRRWGMLKLVRIGTVCLTISAVAYVLLLLLDQMSVLRFWICAAFYMLGFGLIGPSASAIALDPVADMAGRAAALMGSVQLGTGMTFSLLAALLYNHTMNILVIMIVLCSVSALLVAFNFTYKPATVKPG